MNEGMNVIVLNGGQKFADGASEGKINAQLMSWAVETLEALGHSVQTTDINQSYTHQAEVEKFLWADVVVYTFPIWWFHMPHRLKEYIDTVFMFGNGRMWLNDGRTRSDLSRKYGSGGLMQGKKYMVATTWNAPEEAFTDPLQLMQGRLVDEGVLFAFHRMSEFIGFEPALPGMHFHDVLKQDNPTKMQDIEAAWRAHLQSLLA